MQKQLFHERHYSHRKSARAISLRGANHITLRANAFVLRENHRIVKAVLRETQQRYGLKLKALAIMGNHLHLAAKVPSRKAFSDAMRFLASRIALAIGRGRLWAVRVWSRPVTSTRRDLEQVMRYIGRNPGRAGVFDLRIDGWIIVNGMLQNAGDSRFFAWEESPQLAFGL